MEFLKDCDLWRLQFHKLRSMIRNGNKVQWNKMGEQVQVQRRMTSENIVFVNKF